MHIKTIKDLSIKKGDKILVRCDFDVAIVKGRIKEEFRLLESLKTIKFLSNQGAVVILIAHLGRPGGKVDLQFSLKLVAVFLSHALNRRVDFIPEVYGLKVETAVAKAKAGDVILLENLRFDKGEEKNSKDLAKHLVRFADYYVNNAFANSHRAHASMSAIKKLLPSYAGLTVENEVRNLSKILHPDKPLIAVIGGSKIETKLPIIKKFLKNADKILVGGGVANNFLASQGYEIGKSLADADNINLAKKLYDKEKIILPVDVIVRTSRAQTEMRKSMSVKPGDKILDIGPETVRLYSSYLRKANSIIWNGPLGLFESPHFKHGTMSIAQVIGARSKGKAFGVVGGGETVEALNKSGYAEYVDWVSTAGGAMLTFLGGEKMPGLEGIVLK